MGTSSMNSTFESRVKLGEVGEESGE